MRKQVGRQHRQLAREKSAKMSYFLTVVVVLLALSQQLHAIAAEGYRHDSAQYLYMERLRQATRSIADDDGENGAVNPGTLLATSFKDTSPNGGQIGGGGVSSSILHFTVPQHSTTGIGNQEEERPIAKSELWLFPRFTDSPQEPRWYELSLGFVFTLTGFNKPVETQVDGILWRGSDECIMIDLTTQTKIIDRKLKKRDLNETEVNVRVTVHHKEEYHGPTPTEQVWQQTCSSLSNRASNNSFLVVKYFSDEGPTSDGGRKKRRVAYEHPPAIEQSSTDGCSLVPYEVNLQELFGEWVVSPSGTVDVGACAGSCNSDNLNLFTARSTLKDRLSQPHNSPSIIPNHVFQVNCIAVRSSAIKFLINMEETKSLVLVNYPIKAKTCGCR